MNDLRPLNRYRLTAAWGLGVGFIKQTDMYAAIDDAVTLPGFTRADAAVYFTPARHMRLQVNVENLFDTRYYSTANSNNNITPGSPRMVRLVWTIGS